MSVILHTKKVMFQIYCEDYWQAIKLLLRLEKIQIKKILHIQIRDNETGNNLNHEKIIDVLAEVKNVRYMMEAIQEKTFSSNLIEYYTIKHEIKNE